MGGTATGVTLTFTTAVVQTVLPPIRFTFLQTNPLFSSKKPALARRFTECVQPPSIFTGTRRTHGQ